MESDATKNLDNLIQTLWNGIDTNMWHGMSCRCCAGGMFTMSAQILEADLLDYLADKYQSEGLQPLVDVVNEHRHSPTQRLPTWLRALNTETTIPITLIRQLKGDVVKLLKNLQGKQIY